MGRVDVDGLNTGYAALLLEQYLDNPGAVPEEWRELFESEPEALLQRQPGLARLLELAAADGDGHAAPVFAPHLLNRRLHRRRHSPRPRMRSCSAASPLRWPSSRRFACTVTSPRGSIRSARSRRAIPRSSPSG